ncbi:hypothetical protein [Salmonirosea aquatica]|uniref:Uncharacterized protein n=1 Tax=Salmonirosea aquatica TaxID=2654236 RepID=A0A7C9BDP3_9BACT|nr:hypothetical protein [Cytophagaceae bacterium SJW1-29]
MYRLLVLLSFWLFTSSLLAQSLTQRTYEGTINTKIPIILTLTQDGEALFGTVVYKKKGIPITVVGSLTAGNLFLHELMRNGEVTGLYSLEPKGTGWTGTWSAPQRDAKDFTVALKETAKTSVPAKLLPNLTGTYYYAFGKEEGSGELKVVQASPTKITIAVSAVTGGPAYNIATLEKTTLALKSNKAVYENDDFGKCKLLFTFGENTVRVDYLDGAYDCGFGHNASAAGSYVRINARKPEFEEKR